MFALCLALALPLCIYTQMNLEPSSIHRHIILLHQVCGKRHHYVAYAPTMLRYQCGQKFSPERWVKMKK